jgi:hypothetical protein
MSVIEDELKLALDKTLETVDAPSLRALRPDTNLFEHLDSLSVVDMLLEAESRLESVTGRYVTLADETMFDASKSPLRSWRGWVAYVEARHEQ